jgi:RNA polymerase sigma factor (sigma-70 family)
MRAMMQSWEAEYAEFVSARLARLHRQAYLLTGDRHLADDLVQQTCLNLYVHWRKARQADNLAAYVNGTLVKAFLNERRKPWSQRVRVIESPPDLPEVRAGQVEERVLLRQALSRVPRRQRLVLILRFLCDQSVTEGRRGARMLTRDGQEPVLTRLGSPAPGPAWSLARRRSGSMPESNEGAGLLEALRNEAIPPSTVDIGDLVIRGRKRVRTRRRVGMCAAAIGVAAAITIPIILVTQRANRNRATDGGPQAAHLMHRRATRAAGRIPHGPRAQRRLEWSLSRRHAFNGNESRQVVWRDGKVMAPGLPAGDVAPVVNAKGEIAFFSNNIPYVFRAGRFMPLPQPDGYESYRPIQINDRGEILGIYVEASEGRLLIWGANGRITRVADKPFVPTGLGNDGTGRRRRRAAPPRRHPRRHVARGVRCGRPAFAAGHGICRPADIPRRVGRWV